MIADCLRMAGPMMGGIMLLLGGGLLLLLGLGVAALTKYLFSNKSGSFS